MLTEVNLPINGKGYWSFDNDTARNVLIFGVNNSPSSNNDTPKNNFLVLGERTTEGITVLVHQK